MVFKAYPTLVGLDFDGIPSVAIGNRHGIQDLYVVLPKPAEAALIHLVNE
jgi:hypothetical protein